MFADDFANRTKRALRRQEHDASSQDVTFQNNYACFEQSQPLDDHFLQKTAKQVNLHRILHGATRG